MAGKVTITAKNAKLRICKSGRFYEIEAANFRPSEQPAFAKYLELTFALKSIHNNKNKSGFYLVEVPKDKKENFLDLLSDGLEKIVDIESPCQTIHIGTKS